LRAFARFAVGVVVGASLGVQAAQVGSPASEGFGQSVSGLRIGIASSTAEQPASGAEFIVVLENTGGSDFVVNLGSMLGNGRVIWPTAVHLLLTSDGTTRDLRFFDRRYPGIAGRVDDFPVPLRARSRYSFTASLDQYSSTATKELALRLSPGRYRIAARFDGMGAETGNLDMAGLKLMNFWKGTVQSAAAEFQVVARAQQAGGR